MFKKIRLFYSNIIYNFMLLILNFCKKNTTHLIKLNVLKSYKQNMERFEVQDLLIEKNWDAVHSTDGTATQDIDALREAFTAQWGGEYKSKTKVKSPEGRGQVILASGSIDNLRERLKELANSINDDILVEECLDDSLLSNVETRKTYFNDFFEEVGETLNAVPDIKLGGVGIDCDDMYNSFPPKEADVQLQQIVEEKQVIYKNSTKKKTKKKAKAKPSKTSVKSKRK